MKTVVIFRKEAIFHVVSKSEWRKAFGKYGSEITQTARVKKIPRTTFQQMHDAKGRVAQAYLRAVWSE